MDKNVQNLVDRVYAEAIEKANKEAENILSKAQTEADQILHAAKDEAAQICNIARQDAERIKESTQGELKMASRQAFTELKARLQKLLAGKVLSDPINQLAVDTEFLKALFISLVEGWQPGKTEMRLPPAIESDLKDALSTSLGQALNGLEIKIDPGLTGGFTIIRQEEGWLLDFSDTALLEFLRPYLHKISDEFLAEESDPEAIAN